MFAQFFALVQVTPDQQVSAAGQGYAKAQYQLGNYYNYGDGVEKDYAEAIKWYRKAANQNYASAQFFLGVCYAKGTGVEKDYLEAKKWYRKAAALGYTLAIKELEAE